MHKVYFLIKDFTTESEDKVAEFTLSNGDSTTVSIKKMSQILHQQFEQSWSLTFHKKQMVIEIEITTDKEEYQISDFIHEIKEKVLLGVILSLDKVHKYFERSGDRSDLKDTRITGAGFPFVILTAFDGGSLNFYYANDTQHIMVHDNYFVDYKKEQIDALKVIFDKIFISKTLQLSDFAVSTLIMFHTINWVKKPFLYGISIILFSYFDSILSRKPREQLSDLISAKIPLDSSELKVIKTFQIFRNAIAHPATHTIKLVGGRRYEIYKGIVKRGELDINDISTVRDVLIRLTLA